MSLRHLVSLRMASSPPTLISSQSEEYLWEHYPTTITTKKTRFTTRLFCRQERTQLDSYMCVLCVVDVCVCIYMWISRMFPTSHIAFYTASYGRLGRGLEPQLNVDVDTRDNVAHNNSIWHTRYKDKHSTPFSVGAEDWYVVSKPDIQQKSNTTTMWCTHPLQQERITHTKVSVMVWAQGGQTVASIATVQTNVSSSGSQYPIIINIVNSTHTSTMPK